jgi:uncharacterized protein (UPF0276 family)
MVMHGVSLSIGSTDPLNMQYLAELKALIARVSARLGLRPHLLDRRGPRQPARPAAHALHRAALQAHGRPRVQQVQDFLGQRIALENASTYVPSQTTT